MTETARAGRPPASPLASGVARNTVYLASAEIANKALGLLFFLLAARHLGPTEYGTFAFAVAFVAMFAAMPDFGLGLHSARKIARDASAASRLLASGVPIRVIGSLFFMALSVFLAAVAGYPRQSVAMVAVCSISILTGAMFQCYASVFQGFASNQFTALARTCQAAVTLAGAFVLIRFAPSPFPFAVLYNGAGLLTIGLMSIFAYRKFVTPTVELRPSVWLLLLREALPFGLSAIFVVVYYWNGSALLGRLTGDRAVGIYSAAYRLVVGIGFAAAAFSSALLPALARLSASAPEQLRRTMEKSARYMLAIAAPLGIVGTALSASIIGLLYGPAYAESIGILRILVWWGALSYVNALLSGYLIAVGRARTVMIQTGISLLCSIIVNVVLIRRFGAAGAAIGLVAAEAVGVAILTAAQASRSSGIRANRLAATSVRPLMSSLVAAGVGLVGCRVNRPAGLLLAVLCYAALLLLSGHIKWEDLTALRIRSKKGLGD